jgi:ribonuclease-3
LALTHSSARSGGKKPNEDNERLEFLGDRVLGLAVAELLSDRFPKATEGELARWFNQLVRTETCAEVAQSWNLGDFILMSGGEAGSGGRRKTTILANACEAVLGALFADAGYAIASAVVHDNWEPHLGELEDVSPDAKSALQEWAQGKQLHCRGSGRRCRAAARRGHQQAPSRAVGRNGHAGARGRMASARR